MMRPPPLFPLSPCPPLRRPDVERIKGLMKTPVIFDGRNQYDPKVLRSYGYTYFCLGRRQCI